MTFPSRWPRRAVALLPALFGTLLAGCAGAGTSSELAAPQSPAATYQLVDELCAALDPQPLIDLYGGTTATRDWPRQPDNQARKCALGVMQQDPTVLHDLTVFMMIADSPQDAQEAIPSQPTRQILGTWHELPLLGDGAWIWLMPVEKGEVPEVDGPMAGRRAKVHVARGDAYVMLELFTAGPEAPGDAEMEALMVGYAEETLTLMKA
ncbi:MULTISPECIES: hypothetical protein [Micromonospora]|uniref:hypothetical protein n=1 Tax=Micromonospora TaxID=1873 RepID=UPI000C88EAAA|nr:hypothetical protein [Verrucosispora sp. ts21]PMR58168.1 hypothetical protein C1A38_26080 [Verrucosispora sp. ts21]